MWALIFNAFGFLKNFKAGNLLIYLIIFVCLGYSAFTIKGIYNDIKKLHIENETSKAKIEILQVDLNVSRTIAQANAEAFNDIRQYQDKMFKELDRVEKAGIKLGVNLKKVKERIKDDEDGTIAPVLINTLNELHKATSKKPDSNKTNRGK